ncbi:MAG TPA: acyl-CoA dehydratase activase [Verrucomicrobiae bacterium]|nr:acyl-CoA dehydratase activase [Verrucomicrobiae bacterium]
MSHYCGIDVGASAAKLVLIDGDGKIVARALRRSGVAYAETAEACLTEALASAGLRKEDVAHAVSTGYGRHNVPWAGDSSTEIACHGKGIFHYYQKAVSVIDIGAQDNKVIHLDGSGRRTNFKMNRKCAAGTGAFLEEIAYRMNLDVGELDRLAEKSTKDLSLGSFCTVFAATEILARIRDGERVEDIVKGAFRSVVKRVMEMDVIEGDLAVSGGVVAHNPLLVTLIGESFGRRPFVPPEPQFVGAFGAALFARERTRKEATP